MPRLLPLLLLLVLGGCDAFTADSGDADLTLSGSRSGTIQGTAISGDGSSGVGQEITLGDDDSGRTVSISVPGRFAVGTVEVGGGVAVRYSPGVLSEAFDGTAGSVTITAATSDEVRGRLDVGASIFGGEPSLQITGTFRAVER